MKIFVGGFGRSLRSPKALLQGFPPGHLDKGPDRGGRFRKISQIMMIMATCRPQFHHLLILLLFSPKLLCQSPPSLQYLDHLIVAKGICSLPPTSSSPSNALSITLNSVPHFASALASCPEDPHVQHEIVSSLADCVRLVCSVSNRDTFDAVNCRSLATYLTDYVSNGLSSVPALLLSSTYNDLATSIQTPTTDYREMLLRAAYSR